MEFTRNLIMGDSETNGDTIQQIFDGTYLTNFILTGGVWTPVSAIGQDGAFIDGDPVTNGCFKTYLDSVTGFKIVSQLVLGTWTPKIAYTPDGGIAIPMTYGGASSLLGEILAIGVGNVVNTPIDEYNHLGISAQNVVAIGQPIWVVVSGVAQVLLTPAVNTAPGNLILSAAAPNLGTGDGSTVPAGIGALTIAQSRQQIGYALDTGVGGTLCPVRLQMI